MEKIYIETSIVSYLTARPSSNLIAAAWQKETLDWWTIQRHQFALYLSDIVLEEAGMGDSTAASRRLEALVDIPVLPLNESVVELSKVLIQLCDIHVFNTVRVVIPDVGCRVWNMHLFTDRWHHGN
jgi:hypothetical protein